MLTKYYISVYKSCVCNIYLGEIEIWDWLSDKHNQYTTIVEKLRNSSSEIEKKHIKIKKLPASTISGVFSTRRSDALIKHSGLICIDIDAKHNIDFDVQDYKNRILNLPFIMYCGLSVSGNGLMCIVKIQDTDSHKQHFNALCREFDKLGITIDKGCSDITRLRVYSYDKEAYRNPNSSIYADTLNSYSTEQNDKICERSVIQDQHICECNIKTFDNIHPHQNKKEQNIPKYMKLAQQLISQSLAPASDEVKPVSKKQRILNLVEYLTENKIDITIHQNDWFAVGAIISNSFKGQGREIFHQISQFYPHYCHVETDTMYTKILKGKKYKYNTEYLYEIAAQYGVTLP